MAMRKPTPLVRESKPLRSFFADRVVFTSVMSRFNARTSKYDIISVKSDSVISISEDSLTSEDADDTKVSKGNKGVPDSIKTIDVDSSDEDDCVVLPAKPPSIITIDSDEDEDPNFCGDLPADLEEQINLLGPSAELSDDAGSSSGLYRLPESSNAGSLGFRKTLRNAPPSKKLKRGSKSAEPHLEFPIRKIHRALLYATKFEFQMTATAAVYTASILQFLTKTLLELSADVEHIKTISTFFLRYGMLRDREFSFLLRVMMTNNVMGHVKQMVEFNMRNQKRPSPRRRRSARLAAKAAKSRNVVPKF